MKNKLRAFATLAMFAALPVVTFAQLGGIQPSDQGTEPTDILESVKEWINIIIPIVAALALLYFFWQLANYILKTSDDAKGEAKEGMIRGIIALFIIASIWGIIALIGNAFGIGQGGTLDPPEIDVTPN